MVKINHAKISQWIIGLILIQMVLVFVPVIFEYIEKNDQLSVEDVQIIVEDYAVLCYATEGSYPANLDYLVKNYGLILQEDRFIYKYDIFASNVMPEINVFLIEPQERTK